MDDVGLAMDPRDLDSALRLAVAVAVGMAVGAQSRSEGKADGHPHPRPGLPWAPPSSAWSACKSTA